MSNTNALTKESGEKAPTLWIDADIRDDTLVLGKTLVSGATLMIEMVSKGEVVGLICTSLIGRKEIYPYHIARQRT